MKITVLIENSAPEGLIAEHGLSFYIEYQGGRYLLDAGESGAFLLNAHLLGVELGTVEAAFLSHGHYDHGDGFPAFFRANRTAPVYARPAVVEDEIFDGMHAGLDAGIFRRYARRFDLDDGPREPFPGLHLIPDAVIHEQSLVLETAQGLVVLNSCCHAGVDNILADIRARFPDRPLRAVLGGFHLMAPAGTATLGRPEAEVRALARRLRDELEVEDICTGHCTGHPAYQLLAEELGGRLRPLTTGAVFEFPEP